MIACNMCGGTDATVHVDGMGTWHCYDPVAGKPFPHKVAVCETCGHVFSIWPEDLTVKYVDEEYVTCDTDLEQYTTYVQFVLAGIPQRRRRPRILEIGFNQGALLKRFHGLGFECYGIEAGQRNVEAARALMPDAHLDAGLFNSEWISQFPKDYFDVVMLTSVFEHIANPADMLRAIRPYVQTEGRLFLLVPDLAAYTPTMQIPRDAQAIYGCSQMKFFYRNFFHCFAQHVNHFSTPSLTRYLSALGYQTAQIATLGFVWISAVPCEPDDGAFEYPDLVDYHNQLMCRYADLLDNIRQTVIRRLDGKQLVCYGAGKELAYFLDVFQPLGVKVHAIVDDARAGESVGELTVHDSKELPSLSPDVCVATSFDYEREIAKKAMACLPDTVEVYTLTDLITPDDLTIPNYVDFRPQANASLLQTLQPVP